MVILGKNVKSELLAYHFQKCLCNPGSATMTACPDPGAGSAGKSCAWGAPPSPGQHFHHQS